jgi:2-amino-4-hydroxy-6-hydroxymethyldihydropteridine diphosphokinase
MELALSLGSNLGDRLGHLREAVRRLRALPGVRVVAVSPVYETEPVGVKPEFAGLAFLNAVVIVETGREAEAISAEVHAIEDALGRRRGEDRYAPRPMDMDLLYAGELRRDDPALTLPHPRWAERRFVLQPLADLRPDLRLPGSPRTVRETLASLPPAPHAALYARDWAGE